MGEDVYGTFSEVDSELLGSFAGLVPDGIDLNDIHVAGRFLPDYSAGQQSRSFNSGSGSHSLYSPRQPWPTVASYPATVGTSRTTIHNNEQRLSAHRMRDGKTEYLVQWHTCSYLQSTFEPEAGLSHAQKAIAKYQRKRRQITMDAASVQLLDPRRLGMAVPGLGVNTS